MIKNKIKKRLIKKSWVDGEETLFKNICVNE